MNEIFKIEKREDLVKLAIEMKITAAGRKIQNAPQYSETKQEAFSRVENFSEEEKTDVTNFTKIIIWDEKYFSLTLSLDLYDDDEKWHLSMARLVEDFDPEDPFKKIEDKDAKFIAHSFFEDMLETGPEGVFAEIRHFKKAKNESKI